MLGPAIAQIRFEDVAKKAGLDFRLQNAAGGQFHQVELMPGGVAAFDFNNDGCMDLFFTNGATRPDLKKSGPEFWNRLYRNNCDGTFTDVTARAGVSGEGYSMAVATADFDNDGLCDIFVAGVNRNILYRNLGDGRFAGVTGKAGLAGSSPTMSRWDPATEKACGGPQGRFYCHPKEYPGLPNQLFHNNRDGTFTDVSESSGIARHIGKGMGVAFADFDGDGFTDVFVANDSVRHFLFRNQGDGTFREIGREAGVALRDDGAAIAGMGVDFRDFDNDGLPDLVISAWSTTASGLQMSTRPFTGWSLGMYDFDNDDGATCFSPYRISRRLNATSAGARRWRTAYFGTSEAGDSRTALADFDNDGRIDAAVTTLDGPVKLFHNITAGAGHWLAVRLRGARSNRLGLGAVVCVTLPDGRALYGHATTSVGYASSSEPLVRFGLGPHAGVKQVEVRWPGGGSQKLSGVKGDRIIEIEEAKP